MAYTYVGQPLTSWSASSTIEYTSVTISQYGGYQFEFYNAAKAKVGGWNFPSNYDTYLEMIATPGSKFRLRIDINGNAVHYVTVPISNASNTTVVNLAPSSIPSGSTVNVYLEMESNTAPTLTATAPIGTYSTKPSFNYTVADAEGHAMTITESIDGVVFNTRTAVTSGTQLTFTPTDLAWLRTRIKQTVNITITVDDGNGGVTTVNYPITRTTPAIDLALKTPFETDVAARRLLLQLEGNIPADAVVSVQACNNAFDASPTWENATNLVLSRFPYPFNNKVKTAAKWGVSFKVRVERGGSTQPIYVDGIGGAFD